MVCSFFPSLSCCFRPVANLSLRSEFGHNIEKLKETLDKILKDKVTYGFDFTARQITVEVKRPKTISQDVDLYDIRSCRKDTDELLQNLLGKGSKEDRKPLSSPWGAISFSE